MMKAKKEEELLRCPLQEALKVVGGKWKLVLLWHLMEKPHRFNELQRSVGAISTKVLTDQLSQLERAKLVTRHAFPTSPPQVEYRITQAGLNLRPAMELLYQWSVDAL